MQSTNFLDANPFRESISKSDISNSANGMDLKQKQHFW